MYKFMWENGTCYHKVIESAEVNKSFSIVISFTYSTPWLPIMFSYPSLSSPILEYLNPTEYGTQAQHIVISTLAPDHCSQGQELLS